MVMVFKEVPLLNLAQLQDCFQYSLSIFNEYHSGSGPFSNYYIKGYGLDHSGSQRLSLTLYTVCQYIPEREVPG